MNWTELTDISQLDEIDKRSAEHVIMIYKHSDRCSICVTALARLERKWPEEQAPVPYFLDVREHRDVSNAVAERYNVQHESPQVLLIRNGRCEYTRSHLEINISEIIA